jgi:uncharacterized membrane protein YgcG
MSRQQELGYAGQAGSNGHCVVMVPAREASIVALCAICGIAMAGTTPAPESGVIVGDTSVERPYLERAVASATAQAGHQVVLVINPVGRTGTVHDQAKVYREEWPERTIVVVNIADNLDTTAAIRPAVKVKDRFDASTLARIEGGIAEGMRSGKLNKAMAGAVLEVGAIAAGQEPSSRGAWKHPVQLLTGGKDVTDDERLYFLFGTIAALLVLGLAAWWIRLFIHNPKEAIIGLLVFFVEGAVSSAGSGGGGGGGGTSGGGGSFGGGGATGSW